MLISDSDSKWQVRLLASPGEWRRIGGCHAVCARVLPVDRPLYSKADLFEHRRNILRSARSFPQVSKRNHHRQVALLFRALFKNTKDSLDAYTIEGSGS